MENLFKYNFKCVLCFIIAFVISLPSLNPYFDKVNHFLSEIADDLCTYVVMMSMLMMLQRSYIFVLSHIFLHIFLPFACDVAKETKEFLYAIGFTTFLYTFFEQHQNVS